MRLTSVWLALSLAACSGNSAPSLSISDARARPTVTATQTAVVYLLITNSGPAADRLESVATGIGAASLHSSSMSGGVMRMRAIDGVDIPANSTIKFEPMGNHIMVEGLKAPLAAGSSLPLTLRFQSSPPQTITVQVRSSAGETEHHAH